MAFPKGTWYGLYNGEKIEGGKTKQVEAPTDEIPVYLKAGGNSASHSVRQPESFRQYTGRGIS